MDKLEENEVFSKNFVTFAPIVKTTNWIIA